MAELWAGFAIIQLLVLVVFTAWLVRYFALDVMPFLYMAMVFVGWCVPRLRLQRSTAGDQNECAARCSQADGVRGRNPAPH